MVSSNKVSILHSFQDITTFTVYVTSCDLIQFCEYVWNYKLCAFSDSCVN